MQPLFAVPATVIVPAVRVCRDRDGSCRHCVHRSKGMEFLTDTEHIFLALFSFGKGSRSNSLLIPFPPHEVMGFLPGGGSTAQCLSVGFGPFRQWGFVIIHTLM